MSMANSKITMKCKLVYKPLPAYIDGSETSCQVEVTDDVTGQIQSVLIGLRERKTGEEVIATVQPAPYEYSLHTEWLDKFAKHLEAILQGKVATIAGKTLTVNLESGLEM
jgi:hypothetical protein